MKRVRPSMMVALVAVFAAVSFAGPRTASAHCDTLDGPVIQDAKKALDAGDITPVLKWVKPKDEKGVRAAFKKAQATGTKGKGTAEKAFFTTLVKVHRAGEGAEFTGLKPAGAVEPAVAEADKALAGGSSEALLKLMADDIAAGIRKRYERVAEAYRHKDESVAQGREFVEAYVEYTHYVERLHELAVGKGGHEEHGRSGNDAHHKKGGHAHEAGHGKH